MDEETEHKLLAFLQNCTRHEDDAVIFEACKALCEMKQVSNKELVSVLSILGTYLTSSSSSVAKY